MTSRTRYQIYWEAPNPNFEPRLCDGYLFDERHHAEQMALQLNKQVFGAAGRYIVGATERRTLLLERR